MQTEYPLILTCFTDFYNLAITSVNFDDNGKKYNACRLSINGKEVLFRQAKITPKKIGAFVAFWKRSETGATAPFSETDDFDFLVIACKRESKLGAFIFSKALLTQKNLISGKSGAGKRGFRVYPCWDVAVNSQAKTTQAWQSKYFVELSKKNKTLIQTLFG
ncbi:MAG TPA: MepB family protein [Pelobium sp.]